MTGYWDIHNHILPGVDDGSGCMRETMEMLEEDSFLHERAFFCIM